MNYLIKKVDEKGGDFSFAREARAYYTKRKRPTKHYENRKIKNKKEALTVKVFLYPTAPYGVTDVSLFTKRLHYLIWCYINNVIKTQSLLTIKKENHCDFFI